MDIDFYNCSVSHDEVPLGEQKIGAYMAQTARDLKAWKGHLVEILQDSPSKERKFLRWRVRESRNRGPGYEYIVVEEGRLEVHPKTSS